MYAPKDPTPLVLRWLLGFIVAWALVCAVAGPIHCQPLPPRNPAVQTATVRWLADRRTVREATARPGNDGPAVAALIKAGGGVPGEHPEWCGFTQTADQRAHGLPIPASGLQGAARYWFVDVRKRLLPRTFFYVGQRGALDNVQPGDLLGFAWRPNPDIHHITRAALAVPALRRGRPPRGYWSWGGNEGRWPNAGLHYTFYPGPNITAAARWDYK